ncbi:MAG: hypothetical protein GX234_08095 [Clostridiales bacterium]|nr:hypothetical protein [Clostridiales bacterium]
MKMNMEKLGFKMEDLLPLAAELTEKYTSRESSSVTYETAEMLMEAVCYCMREELISDNPWKMPTWFNEASKRNEEEKGLGIMEESKEDARKIYKKGYQKVVDKVLCTKEKYERLIAEFEDFGCKNYRDTVLKGLPGFFLYYDPKFSPQNHILTLDYPDLYMSISKYCGVDLIYEYVQNLEYEKKFLTAFDRQAVAELLEEICEDYSNIFMGNICYEVLFRSIECFLADRSCLSLRVSEEDRYQINAALIQETEEETERQVRNIIRLMSGRIADGDLFGYLSCVSHEITVRLRSRTALCD